MMVLYRVAIDAADPTGSSRLRDDRFFYCLRDACCLACPSVPANMKTLHATLVRTAVVHLSILAPAPLQHPPCPTYNYRRRKVGIPVIAR